MRKLTSALLFCAIASQALAAGPAPVQLTGAWVRALPPGQPNTAAYVLVTNTGDAAVEIVGGSASIAGTVEMHTTVEVEGYQRMQRLTDVQIAPGQAMAFAPGGAHLMLLELKQVPAPGDTVQLCLQLADGQQVCTTADVRKSAGDEQSHEHHQH